jgi:asparagine synthase (glutamine-hydrolysing)
MSGICGIAELGGEIGQLSLTPMSAALMLPDESSRETLLSGRSAAFGVRSRWSFQQAGAIPGVRIAADADLLNDREIVSELTQRGINAEQISMAERLGWLYRIHGDSFVKRLDGAFAVAVWDEAAERLVLAIDRLGVKGLYWSEEGGRLLFGSRISAVCAARERQPEVNSSALMQYLLFSVVPAPLAIYQNVNKMKPGCRLIWEQGRVREEQYWDLNYVEEKNNDERYWIRELRAGMRSAVHRHLLDSAASDTGSYLSGGTDSSSVVAFMAERHSPVNTFSISFAEGRYNEAGYARLTANHFATRHHERCLSAEDATAAIPKILQCYDEPFANSSTIGAYYCALLAHENGVDTLLAGDGGDELFAGNSRYASDERFAMYHNLPGWLRRGLIEPLAFCFPANDGLLSRPRKYVERANIPNPRRLFSYGFFLSNAPEEIFESDFLARVSPDHWMDIAESHYRKPSVASELNRQMYLDVKLILADNDLRKVQSTAELAGVRVRFPLLDHPLAEFSSRIPTKLKMKGSKLRYIFKEAMRGILPDQVLTKKKHGFGVPVGLWFFQDERLKSMARDVLSDSRTRQRGYFRRGFLEKMASWRSDQDAFFYGEVIWYLLALELWHREHLESKQRQGSTCAR